MVDCTDLVGTPFKYGGRGPDAFDCYGLVMECGRRNGVTLPDFGFSNKQSVICAMMGATMPQWQEVDCAAGAIALIRVGRLVSHVGWMLDADRMLHTWDQSGGVVIERVGVWERKIIGFYKHVR